MTNEENHSFDKIIRLAAEIENRINFWISNDTYLYPEIISALNLVRITMEQKMIQKLQEIEIEDEDEDEDEDENFSDFEY